MPEKVQVDPLDRDREVKEARKGGSALLTMNKERASRLIRDGWHRLDPFMKERSAELKVNFLRYSGDAFVQVHPDDPTRIWMPEGIKGKSPPSINKLRRTLHRYVAQVTADEPVIEATPASHADEDRDASEAATHVLRGEWERMKLQLELQRATHVSGIFRSAFWFFEWDDMEAGKRKAQKFFRDEKGQRYLAYVDEDGNEVAADLAAEIPAGNIRVEVLTPMNVRWSGGRYAHDAEEVWVGKVVTLRQLFDRYPESRDLPVTDLLHGVPPEAELWLQDLRGENFTSTNQKIRDEEIDEDFTAEQLDDPDDSVLAEKVFLLTYFRRPSRSYPDGFHCVLAGKHVLFREKLRYRVLTIAHFKFLDEIADVLGVGLIDILRDPQELLDFVNGQILRYLQSFKRRWFVPHNSNIRARELLSPARSIIEFNPKAGPPIPEQHPAMPNDLVEWADRFKEEFEDESTLHATMMGKHVPGVSSGRHAEALRAGDETVLGLSRAQLKEGVETAGRIILEMVRREWSDARRVRYFGEDKEYVDLAFSAADLADTSDVRLKKGTLLMLTPMQKSEMIFAYAEMQAISPQEVRQLAPMLDVAGLSLTEDEHYKRASRENALFMGGPPDELMEQYASFREQLTFLDRQADELTRLGFQIGTAVEPGLKEVQGQVQQVVQQWQQLLAEYLSPPRPFEVDPGISTIHARVHAKVLAARKVDRFPDWWRDAFEQHWQIHYQTVQAAQQPQSQSQAPGTRAQLQPGVPGDLPREGTVPQPE
jgi:hypothetical protein